MNVGIEFKMKDGTTESFDPVDGDNPFEISDGKILINHTHSVYQLKEDEVESHRIYDLCESCGYELKDSFCSNYHCEQFIDQ